MAHAIFGLCLTKSYYFNINKTKFDVSQQILFTIPHHFSLEILSKYFNVFLMHRNKIIVLKKFIYVYIMIMIKDSIYWKNIVKMRLINFLS